MPTTDALRVGTLKCPIDKEPLHFEVFQGMRVRRNDEYSARCPKCQRHYQVRATKEPTA